jgi:SAM-dependent methyltransferase
VDDLLYRQHATLEDVHWWFVGRQRIVRRLVARWVPRGGSLLDVGCGAGGTVAALGSEYDARGVDASPAAVEACHARGITRVTLGSATDPSTWGRLPVDAVSLLDVIEHVDDDVAALRAAAAATGPGGRVIVTVPAYEWLWSEHDTRNHHHRRYTRRRLLERHAAAGLEPLQSGYFNTLLFPAALVQRGLARLGIATDPLRLPPEAVNRPLGRLFAAEGKLLAGGRHSFPFGLSVFCVSTARAPAAPAART